MRLYHVTDRDTAEKILDQGFEDSEVLHDNEELQIGVWLSDRCLLDEEDVGPRLGPVADVALQIELPEEAVEPYERLEEGKPYREFCVPADIVNEREIEGPRELEEIEPNERRRRGDALEAP
jgi:hypothetical protein